ncbi:MAG: D-alanyl-D-alanine carboxypeptidase family protein, partial [Clostridia bacterium]|nr:D-alanyl-D-alanine carboxypeptidase family protein [Clostridia bacterium]
CSLFAKDGDKSGQGTETDDTAAVAEPGAASDPGDLPFDPTGSGETVPGDVPTDPGTMVPVPNPEPQPAGTPDPQPEPQPDPAEQPPQDPGDGKHVSSISLDKYKVVVQVGQTDMPWVTMYPETAEDKGEVWTSNNTEIATVNSWGKITGVNEGECQVTVRSSDNPDVKAVVDVTVTAREAIHVEQITLDKYEVTVCVGLSDMPWVTMYPTTATDKGEIWTSSDTAIATVGSYGQIFGVGVGVCTVTVQSKDNPEVEAKVEVKVVPRPVFTEATYINGILVVNKTYGLPAGYNPGVDPVAKAALDRMFEAAEQDGIKLWVESGFRSYELQGTIYNNYVSREGQAAADRYSARPGHSEHQTGLSFDLNSFDMNFGSTPEGRWLSEHCWDYGFILRYPADKEDITAFMAEPWHVRYVGEDVAKTLKENGQVLEEFLDITSAYPQ